LRLGHKEKKSLWQKIRDVALTDVGVLLRGMDEGSLEKLEELLIASDFGAKPNRSLSVNATAKRVPCAGKSST
jgi:hypothetical protein